MGHEVSVRVIVDVIISKNGSGIKRVISYRAIQSPFTKLIFSKIDLVIDLIFKSNLRK